MNESSFCCYCASSYGYEMRWNEEWIKQEAKKTRWQLNVIYWNTMAVEFSAKQRRSNRIRSNRNPLQHIRLWYCLLLLRIFRLSSLFNSKEGPRYIHRIRKERVQKLNWSNVMICEHNSRAVFLLFTMSRSSVLETEAKKGDSSRAHTHSHTHKHSISNGHNTCRRRWKKLWIQWEMWKLSDNYAGWFFLPHSLSLCRLFGEG